MRQSCQILRQIEHLKGTATTALLAELLPDIDIGTISATIGNMRKQDRVQLNGKVPGARGYYYRVNENWEPGKARSGGQKRPGQRGPNQSDVRRQSQGNFYVIRFRDQKIKMLRRLFNAGAFNGKEEDLAIGLLADLGFREKP